ncbi:MAG: prenyltransferase/squalene [Planctomycetota bacterium]|nr:MAG: prenyltransferase/squalene [Planctomycetota bacterium]
MTRLAAALLALALLPRPASAQADEALQKQINAAIDKGVEYLKGRQLKDTDNKGSWPDGTNLVYDGGKAKSSGKMFLATTALSLLTLLKCGVDPDEDCIRGGLDWLDKVLPKEYGEVKKGRPDSSIMGHSYHAGILLMMYEALTAARADKQMKADGKDPAKDPRPALKPDAKDLAVIKRIVQWLKDTQSRKGGWRYGPPVWDTPGGIEEDPSASQIALLGLSSAGRLGVEAGDEVWKEAATWYLEAQEKNGPAVKGKAAGAAAGGTYDVRDGDRARGWPYLRRSSDKQEEKVTGSMTACGVGGLVLCKGALAKSKLWTKGLAAAVDRAIYDGLAWIDLHYTVDDNPGAVRSHFYYLYGVERLGTLGNFEKIGAHAWYVDGAKLLVAKQAAGGEWNTHTEIEPCDIIDTCFALLFLKRATVPVGVTLTR